jgi:hypothetical protein
VVHKHAVCDAVVNPFFEVQVLAQMLPLVDCHTDRTCLEVLAACQANSFVFHSIILLGEVHADVGDQR